MKGFFLFFLQYDSFLVENIVLKSSGDAQHGRFYTFYTVFQFDQYRSKLNEVNCTVMTKKTLFDGISQLT